jgi:hypothetical protein
MSWSTPDRQAIGALNPRAVVGYLRLKGWEKSEDYGLNAVLFARTIEGTCQELLVPVASQAPDFAKVMEVLVDDLAKVEDRSAFDMISDLSMAAFDVVRIRSPEADSFGSVLLSNGVELHENARDMLQSAANAAALGSSSRAVWMGRSAGRVNDYLSALRLGQSQRGSFVISLLSPWDFVPPADRDQSKLGFIEPFGRQVTQKLAQSLEAISGALRRAATEGVQTPFSQAVSHGVSSNLCAALADLARDGEGVDVSIRWSLTKPLTGTPLLRLTREDAQALSEAAEKLSAVQPVPDTVLHGIITNLNEEVASFDGKVTIETQIEKRPRRITMEFNKSDIATRDKLIEAFRKRERIAIKGDLERDGKRLRLANPRELQVVTLNDAADAAE